MKSYESWKINTFFQIITISRTVRLETRKNLIVLLTNVSFTFGLIIFLKNFKVEWTIIRIKTKQQLYFDDGMSIKTGN